jgi:hypothetical protein
MEDLAKLNPLYQWSLDYFLNFIRNRMDRIDDSHTHHSEKQRIDFLEEDFKANFVQTIHVALKEDHKSMFLFLIALKKYFGKN